MNHFPWPNLAEAQILGTLHQHGPSYGMEIAKHLSIPVGSIYVTLGRAIRKGLISRTLRKNERAGKLLPYYCASLDGLIAGRAFCEIQRNFKP